MTDPHVATATEADPLRNAEMGINAALRSMGPALAAVSADYSRKADDIAGAVATVMHTAATLPAKADFTDRRGKLRDFPPIERDAKYAEMRDAADAKIESLSRVSADMATELAAALESELRPGGISLAEEPERARAVELLTMISGSAQGDFQRLSDLWIDLIETDGDTSVMARLIAGPWGRAYALSTGRPEAMAAHNAVNSWLRSRMGEYGTDRQRKIVAALDAVERGLAHVGLAHTLARQLIARGPFEDLRGSIVVRGSLDIDDPNARLRIDA